MDDAIKQRVLKATGFSLPDAYIGLLQAGRLQFGNNSEHWAANWQTIVMTEPPALVCSPWHLAVEWFSIDELIDWAPPDYWKPNRFVSFAGNGCGDQWCWDPDRTNKHGTPILLCRHDEDEAEIFAASFSDFLYRILVESFAYISYDARNELNVDDDQYRRYLDLNIQTVAPYLHPDRVATLQGILRNDFTDDEKEECLYLITKAEKDRILEREIFIGDVGQTFEHMEP